MIYNPLELDKKLTALRYHSYGRRYNGQRGYHCKQVYINSEKIRLGVQAIAYQLGVSRVRNTMYDVHVFSLIFLSTDIKCHVTNVDQVMSNFAFY